MLTDSPTPARSRLFTSHTWLFLGFVVVLSYLTYFHNYWNPNRVFWDENYHIASAQKYLNNVYFMEQHPPLGKLLIALGEKLINPNAAHPTYDTMYVNTDYATDFPNDFSFAGFRFFSAFLGWLTAPLVFFIFLLITRNPLHGALLSFLYIFDNALVVHIRGAMLEGPLMFFTAAMVLVYLLLLEWRTVDKRYYWGMALFGVTFGLTLMTKLFGLAMILLLPALLWKIFPDWKKIVLGTAAFVGGFLVIFVGVWQIHFALGDRINPQLPDQGYYQASPEYKQILAQKKNGSLLSTPTMIRDSLAYVPFYNRGAPRLDLCKADENGSPFFLWPLGARSINYRWETPNGQYYKYLYLQSNPMVWLPSFAAVLLALALLAGSILFDLQKPLKHPYLLTMMTGIYVSYMIAISQIDRVLYLYHYFTPLLLSMIILGLVFMELDRFWKWRFSENGKTIGLLVFAGLIFLSFQYYWPLSYYGPLTDAQLKSRALLPVWELSCVRCQRVNSLAVPRPNN